MSKKRKDIYNDYDRNNALTGVFKSTPETRFENYTGNGKLAKFIELVKGPQKYRYLGVNFWDDDTVHYYRTEDRSIRKGKVVMVPVSYGPDRPAVVVSAKWYSEGYAPYPLKWTPMITGPAKFRDQIKFDLAGMKRERQERPAVWAVSSFLYS